MEKRLEYIGLLLALGCMAPRPVAVVESGIALGGSMSAPGTMVALLDDDRFFCSGTLIAPRVVLTAGHCPAALGGRVVVGALEVTAGTTASALVANAVRTDMYGGPNDVQLILLDRELAGPFQPLTDAVVGQPQMAAVIRGYGENGELSSHGAANKLRVASVIANRTNWQPSDPSIQCNQPCGYDPRGIGMHCIQQDFVRVGKTHIRPSLPMVEHGDSGGPITTLGGRQFGITSFGDDIESLGDCLFASPYGPSLGRVGYFAPLNRGWIDNAVQAWQADQNRCYPNWPDTLPRGADGRCGRGAQTTTAPAAGQDDDDGGLDNDAHMCTRAELNAMLAHNQQILGLMQIATAEHNALYQGAMSEWDQAYNAWFDAHPECVLNYMPGPCHDAAVSYLGSRPVAPPLPNAQQFLAQLQDPSDCALEIAMSDAGVLDLNGIDNCLWHELFHNARELVNPTGQLFDPNGCDLTNNLTPPQFNGPCDLAALGYEQFQACLWNQFHFLDASYVSSSSIFGSGTNGNGYIIPPGLAHVQVYIGNTFIGSWNYTSYPGIAPCFQWMPGSTPGGAIYAPTMPENSQIATIIGNVGTCN